MTPAQLDAIMNGPALTPPAGVTPNFQNPPNQNTMARAVTGVCLAVAALLVGLRVYVKVFCTKRCRLEDCEYMPPDFMPLSKKRRDVFS